VVDDEQSIREASAKMLKEHGYTVLTAASGESALDIFRQDPKKIDLILLDLAMPGMGGSRCLQEIITLDPRAKVIIVSGYIANLQVKESLDNGAKGVIAKPFQMGTLLQQVRAVLDS
jgi:DNA-binding response OmpR family regulator